MCVHNTEGEAETTGRTVRQRQTQGHRTDVILRITLYICACLCVSCTSRNNSNENM